MRIASRRLCSLFRCGLVVLLALGWADLLVGGVALAFGLDDHAHATSLVRHDGHTHVVFAHEHDETSGPTPREISLEGGDHVFDVPSPGDAIRSKPNALERNAQPLAAALRLLEAPVRARCALHVVQLPRSQLNSTRTVVLRL